MHLLIACAITLVFVIVLERSRIRASGLLVVLKDYAWQVFQRMSLKRVIYIIGILLFVLAAWQAVGFDWAFVALGGDAMLYLEIVSVIYLMALRGFTQQIAKTVLREVVGRGRASLTALRSRSRGRRSLRRHSSSGDRGDEEPEPEMEIAFALSAA